MAARTISKIGGMSATRQNVLEDIQKDLNDGWRRFIDIYAPTVHRFSRTAGLDSADSDEVLSETLRNLLRFFRNGGVIDPQKGCFQVYLREVINNAIRQQKRKLARTRGREEVSDETPAELSERTSTFRMIERLERMRGELDKLFSEQQVKARDLVVFECYAIEHEAVEDVAHWFSISEGRVYAIKHEIIQILRERIESADQRAGEE